MTLDSAKFIVNDTASLPRQSRTVDRGSNPFAPIAKQQNQALTPQHDVYQTLADRVNNSLSIFNDSAVKQSLAALSQRLGGQLYRQEHFGRLELVPFELIDINIDIQRDLELMHIAYNIIQHFDPRIVQPVNVTYIRSTGRYSAWDGQQSSAALLLIYQAGLIEGDFAVQCKVFDDDLQVPGSRLRGESVGNYGFRKLNGDGREGIDAYFMHRSRVNGVRLYGSELEQDKQSEEIQQILEANHMFPAKASEARGRQARPGMVTYISGINNIAGHGTQRALFDVTKQDLDHALAWHDRYYASEKGVDGGFILAFGRLYAAAREQNITITAETEEGLYHLFQSRYGSPGGFHADCKQRLKAFQKKNDLKESWSDSCLTPILVSDYVTMGGPGRLPRVDNMVTYAGV
jgi:hypothetical protein